MKSTVTGDRKAVRCEVDREQQGRVSASNGSRMQSPLRCAMLAVLVSAPTFKVAAQEQSSEAPESALEEVIVTAQRREESLQSVPMSITSLDQTALENNSATSLNDVLYLSPSLSFSETGYGSSAIIANIRGQGVFGGRNPSVGMYLDEVALPQAGPQAPGSYVAGAGFFYDMESVQVLKGPQGTLFGRNTTGGAFLLETKRPGADFGGNVQLSAGNYNSVEFTGAVDVPLIGDKLLSRFAVQTVKRDGYVDIASAPGNSGGMDSHDDDSVSWRATLLWKPTDAIENDLVVSNYQSRTNGTQLIIEGRVQPGTLDLPALASYAAAVDAIIAEQHQLGIRKVGPQFLAPDYDVDLLTVSNRTSVDLTDTMTLRGILGYSRQKIGAARSFDGTELGIFSRFDTAPAPDREQYTAELQLQGQALAGALDWTVGAFYFDLPTADFEQSDVLAFNGSLFANQTRSRVNYSEESVAGYLQLGYKLTDKFKVTGGYRHTEDKADQTQFGLRVVSGSEVCPPQPATSPFDANCRLALDGDWSADTWTVGLDYQWTPQVLVYGAARRGYRSGGFNFVSLTDPRDLTYDPETVTDYEIGLKAEWHLGSMPMRTNLAAYYDELKDAQVTLNVPSTALTGLSLAIQNAAGAEIKGGELEITAQPTDNLNLTAYVSLLDFAFTDFAPGTSQNNIDLIVGSETYGRPKTKYGVSLDYSIPASVGTFKLYANYNHTSEQATNSNNPLSTLEAHGLLNLSLGWNEMFGSAVDLTLYATNALDEDYQTYVIAESSLGYYGHSYGPPRLWGARVSYKFGAH
jgi:iron complex outermembrane receptor protein